MEITFKGSGVTVYGAKRNNHGMYTGQSDSGHTHIMLDVPGVNVLSSVQMDNGAVETRSSWSAENVFQSVLYSITGLTPTVQHTLVGRTSISRGRDDEAEDSEQAESH